LSLAAMEYVEGQSLEDLYGIAPLSPDVQQAVPMALEILQMGNFVFGDLPRPNVMLANGTQPVNERIHFIDSNWAGEEG
ncbi:hypothetical protein BDP27DRAFT_1188952, partial [Rhodocollybia butyracea]